MITNPILNEKYETINGGFKKHFYDNSSFIDDSVDKLPSRRFQKTEISIYGSKKFYIHYI